MRPRERLTPSKPRYYDCPFCGKSSTLGDENQIAEHIGFDNDNVRGPHHLLIRVVVCPNQECREFTLAVSLRGGPLHRRGSKSLPAGTEWSEGVESKEAPPRIWRLVPESDAKVLPSYVPAQIREDYEEACLIRERSPKAAATLGRRALQGMIRDFWGIKRRRLKDEIDALQDKVDPATWEAIDAVRTVGNVGAHMERDVDLVIEVDPGEAQQLIQLVEVLIEEWYVHRHERNERVKAVKELGARVKKEKDASS